ncbi:hypothetical protein QE422_002067 [Chryseobacterium sp. SORGH_AS 447]|uniref:hypothetical protein n=1 Tax=Chryseobacterium sp. SORGH_AS_0447 TaxID=3041769 RepID=UPI00278AB2B3|nr:hypothetical protein [Chryseobacterium sp. SORGH_AS_0447]MDQ1161699.1 hypothetical protein [Chryseobacterium sp. SORGH_AS_0447]
MKITIPKPCHENWETMTPNEKGRFCSVCSKTVKDFTASTDEEIIKHIKSDPGICGRFMEGQLGRELSFSVISTLTFGLFVLSSVAFTVNGQQMKDEEVKKIDFKKGINGIERVKDTLLSRSIILGMPSEEDYESVKPMIMLNNKRISEARMKRLKPEQVKSVIILTGEGAKEKYGRSGENGVIIIESKKEDSVLYALKP